MSHLFQRSSVHPVSLTLALCLVAVPALAQKKGNRANDARRHTADAAQVFDEIMSASDSAIPKVLVDKAQAIAVFPGVLKAALLSADGRERA